MDILDIFEYDFRETKQVEEVAKRCDIHRDSQTTAFAWRSTMGMEKVFDIQNMCTEPMDTLGYRHLAHERELLDTEGVNVLVCVGVDI